MIDIDVKALTSFLVFFFFFLSEGLHAPRLRLSHCACLSALLGGVKLVLGQCEIGTDHNRVAAGQVSV